MSEHMHGPVHGHMCKCSNTCPTVRELGGRQPGLSWWNHCHHHHSPQHFWLCRNHFVEFTKSSWGQSHRGSLSAQPYLCALCMGPILTTCIRGEPGPMDCSIYRGWGYRLPNSGHWNRPESDWGGCRSARELRTLRAEKGSRGGAGCRGPGGGAAARPRGWDSLEEACHFPELQFCCWTLPFFPPLHLDDLRPERRQYTQDIFYWFGERER